MTPELIATLILAAVAVVYVLLCWALPFGRCRWCSGTGTAKTLIMRRLRSCRMCGGSRKRLRIGRRIYNAVHNANTDAARAARAKNGGAS
ncbi:hypothetical protein [Catellatospora chokoriensis]|uniref:hypothetical protein n=1 Tax=Catellatospora chokoriensis TaxID=310353 RepID=UPI00177E38F8|nr:hypothetical protein [Catellatospora chokoriensis]